MSFQILIFNKLVFQKPPIISLNGEPVLLFTAEYRSLLAALETKPIKVFSECRNGFCGACKTRILNGKVTYFTTPLAALKDDECLPCCCIPNGDLDLALSTSFK